MANRKPSRIFTVNSGSSSIKFSLYEMDEAETRVLSGRIEGIGLQSGAFHVDDRLGRRILDKPLKLPNHAEALREAVDYLQGEPSIRKLEAVGHRLVHGGKRFIRTHIVTPDLLEEIEQLIPLAPDHMPHEINAIRVFATAFPKLKQVACFDTAFHRDMPPIAQIYAIPWKLRQEGIIRYGFHGLSYEYIAGEFRRETVEKKSADRLIIAHLGNGASMAAIKSGKSLDTTMGFSPAGGLVMSTRTGDLDPEVLLYLFREKSMDLPAVNRMVNKEGGLLGISGISAGMEDLLAREADNHRAAEAIELFCYQARKFLGALAAVLGGLDALIFTGGIGENAPSIRLRICASLEFLGIRLDPDRNDANEPIISQPQSAVTVRVMKTNEELMIARHTYRLINNR